LITLDSGGYWLEPIEAIGISTYCAGVHNSRISKVLGILKRIRRSKPHVIQCQHFYSNVYGGIIGRLLGIPSLGAIRSNGFHELRINGRLLSRLAMRLPHYIVANSKMAMRNMSESGFSHVKMYHLPNVVDTRRFSVRQRRKDSNCFTIVGVGRLERVKRFDRFISITKALARNGGGRIKAVIAGGGSERASLEKEMLENKDPNWQGELLGQTDDPVAIYREADAFLLTSDSEGMPNVVMEAMACGLPVVVSKVGGVPEIVEQGITGFTFDADDQNNAVLILRELSTNYELVRRIGDAGRKHVVNCHSVLALPELLLRLYCRVGVLSDMLNMTEKD